MYTKVVSVLADASGGGGVQDITFTADPSWTPKVAIVQWNRANTSTDTFQEHNSFGMGFTDGTNQRCVTVSSEDNAARADTATLVSNTTLITALSPSGTVTATDAVATFTQWLSNGMQITWSDAPAAQFYIHVTFLGGTDITNATVGTITTPTGTGEFSETGLAYQPDFGMFLYGNLSTMNTGTANAFISAGAATSSSAQWTQTYFALDNPVTMDTYQCYSHSNVALQHTTTSITGRATFVSFNSNGFTLNAAEDFAVAQPIFYLVMKGGNYSVGNATEPASTQQQTITTNKDVKAVMVLGLDIGTADAVQAGAMWTCGMGTASGNQGVNVYEDTDAVADSIVVSRHDTNQIYLNITSNATAGSSTLDDEAALYSVSSTNFVLDWTNIGQARPFRYVTFGTGESLTSVEKSLTTRYNIEQTITKQLTVRYDIAQEITKQLTTRYDVTSLVTKQLTTRYDISAEIAKSLTLRYDITSLVEKTLTTRYDITSLVTKQLTLRYDVEAEAAASVMTQVVRFQKDSSGTADVTQDINLNFTPKAILVFSNGSTADNSVSAHYQVIQGMSDGTNHVCISGVSEDGQGASDACRSYRTDSVFVRLLEAFSTITIKSQASCTFGTNKVTFTWTVNDTDATYITLVAYGGDGITNVKCLNNISTGTNVTGTKDYTIFGFDPVAGESVLFTLNSNFSSAGTGIAVRQSFGCAVSATKRWVINVQSEDAADPTDTWRLHRDDACLFLDDGVGGVYGYADFDSWITGGVRLNWIDAPTSSTILIPMMIIKGGKWDCGSLTSPTSAQSQNTSVSVSSNALRGLLIAGTGVSTANSITTENTITIGATDGTNESVIAAVDEDDQTTSDSYRVSDASGNVVRLLTTNGANAAVAAFTSFGSNQFTLNWTTASAAQYFGWVVVAGGAGLASIEKQLTLRYNLEQEIIKQLTLRYNIEQAITKSLTLRYDVTALAEKTLTLLYNLEQEITKSLTTRYDISAELEKALTIIYNIGQEVEKSLTTRFNIEQQIEKSLTTRYNIEQEIIKSLILRYDIEVAGLTEVVKSLTLLYNVEQEIEKSLTLRYDVTEKVPTVPITLRYDITQLIEKTLTLRHNIEQEIEKALTLLYNIEEQAIKTLTTRYNIEQAIEKINTIRYDITALLEKPLTLRYNITSLVEKPLTVRYDITQQVPTVPVTIRYNISQEIEKTNTLLYNIEQEIEKGLTIRYDIEGALAQIIKSLTLRYNIDAQAIKTLTTRYNIENTILKSLTMRYDITQLVPEKSVTLRWNILQQIIKSLTIRHQIEASLAVLITDRGYREPLRARIQFIARGTPATVYYTYDSFDPDNRPFNVIALDVRLAQGEIGTFSLSIEDSADIVDKSKIGLGVKVIIDVKKEATGDWQRMITGFVRRIRPERPATGALIYEITGYGSQVIFNERIVNFKRAAKRMDIMSPDPLPTDLRMQAHNLFRDLVSATDILPIRKPALQDTGNFTSLDGISKDVTDFIAQIAPGLTDAAAVANAIAEITGSIWGTDEYGNPYFRYPTSKHSGIIIKDVPESTDSALDTSINLAPFDYDDSIDTTEGFANRLYVLNAVDTKSTASSSGAAGSTTLTLRWIAQQFTATDNNITGAAFILSKIGEPTTEKNTIYGFLRADSQGYPRGPTLASFQITFDQVNTAKSTIFVNDLKPETGTIIPGNKYWWVLTAGLADDSNTIRWHHDNDQRTPNRLSALLPNTKIDPTDPGDEALWSRSVYGPTYAFSAFSSIRHILEHSDPESIKQYGLIEQIVDLPAFEDDATFQKALAKIIAYSAKPKRIYQYNLVTIPTGHLFMPGQLVTVVDSKAKLTSEKNVIAEIAECTYNWDTSSNAIGCKYCDVHLIGFLDTKLDDYLDEKVC